MILACAACDRVCTVTGNKQIAPRRANDRVGTRAAIDHHRDATAHRGRDGNAVKGHI